MNWTTYEKMQEIVLSYEQRGYKTSDRRFSVDAEWVYRLIHSDFDNLPTKEAAGIMGLSQRQVQRLLEQLRFTAPQLFSISKKTKTNRTLFKALFSWEYLPKIIRSSVDIGWGF